MATKDDFSRVPEVLLGLLGDLVPVVDLELTPERKLAQEDVLQVMEQLQKQGWYLQLPKTDFVPRSQ